MEFINLLSFYIYNPNLASPFKNSLVFLSLLLIRNIFSFCPSFPINDDIIILPFNTPINTAFCGCSIKPFLDKYFTLCNFPFSVHNWIVNYLFDVLRKLTRLYTKKLFYLRMDDDTALSSIGDLFVIKFSLHSSNPF